VARGFGDRMTVRLAGVSVAALGVVGLAATVGSLSGRVRPVGALKPDRRGLSPVTVHAPEGCCGSDGEPAGESVGAAVVQDEELAPADPVTSHGRAGTVRLLGHCVVEGAGGRSGGWTADTSALFGLLAENRGYLLPKSAALAKLWPADEPREDRFAGVLKAARSRLCDGLGLPGNYGRVVIEFERGAGYRLNPELLGCDVWQFRDLLGMAGRCSGLEKVAALSGAVELYRGPYLADVPQSWARQAAGDVNRAVVEALAQLAGLENDPERKVAYLERATMLDRAAEPLFRERLRIYASLGRLQAVHYCFEDLRESLKRRGSKPSAATEQLYQAVTGSS